MAKIWRKEEKNKNNKKKNEIYIRDPAYVEAVRKKNGKKVAGWSRDRLLTFKQHFFDVSTRMAKCENSH